MMVSMMMTMRRVDRESRSSKRQKSWRRKNYRKTDTYAANCNTPTLARASSSGAAGNKVKDAIVRDACDEH